MGRRQAGHHWTRKVVEHGLTIASEAMECAGPSAVVFDPTLTDYDFGPQHPMAPIRVALTMQLAHELGITGERLRVVKAPHATLDQIATVHDPALIEAVQRAGNTGAAEMQVGLGSDDNPVFLGMHEAAAHVVGASLEAFRLVHSGEAQHAANITGGLHHAMRDRAAGFCVYNDVAIGIQWLLDQGVQKVAYVDVDVHHGDGVQSIFWDDPRVLTISVHETGQFLFPGTGFSKDTGGEGAEGSAVNVSLPPGTADAGWLRAFHAVVPELLREFQPEVLVTQHGCDSHAEDPLAHLMLSVDGQRAAYLALHELAHEVAGGRWVATGGGGYALVEVVPARLEPPARRGRRASRSTRRPDPRGVARVRRGAGRRRGAAADDRRPHPGVPRLARGLRPRHLAGPRGQRDPQRGLPAARPRPAALSHGAAVSSTSPQPGVESAPDGRIGNRPQTQADTPDHSAHFPEPLPHESQLPLFSLQRQRGDRRWGSRRRAAQESRCSMAGSGDMSDAKFLTVAEVAAMMRVSKMTVYRLVHNGDLPAVRVGRSFRVVEEDVNEYLRKSFYSAG